MTFTDRIKQIGQALFGKTLAGGGASWIGLGFGGPQYTPVRFDKAVAEGMAKNELIYSCEMYKADSAGQVELCAYGPDGEEIEDGPVADLLAQPNPQMAQFDLLGLILIHNDLAGGAYFRKVRSKARIVVELWPLRPDWISPITESGGRLKAWKYETPGAAAEYIDPADVLFFKLPHPMNLYRGLPPMQALARMGDVDNATTDFLANLMQSGGVPLGALKTSATILTDAQREKVREQFRQTYGGSRNWGNVAVFDANIEYQRIGLNLAELGFAELDKRTETRICAALRVPPILVGAKAGLDRATYSNYGEARQAFWQDVMLPQLGRIQASFSRDIYNETGQMVEVRLETGKVAALQEVRASRWTSAADALSRGAITRNEFYAEVGMEEQPDGDVYLLPSSALVTARQEDSAPMTQTDPTATEPQAGDNPDDGGGMSDGAEMASSRPAAERKKKGTKAAVGSLVSEFTQGAQDILDALAGGQSVSEAEAAWMRLVDGSWIDAAHQGWVDGGQALSDLARHELVGQLSDQRDFARGLFDRLVAKIEAANGEPVDLQSTLDLWRNSLIGQYNTWKIESVIGTSELFYWNLGATEQHCATCVKLSQGPPHTAGWYERRGYIPSQPGSSTECGGWRCDCYWTDASGSDFTYTPDLED